MTDFYYIGDILCFTFEVIVEIFGDFTLGKTFLKIVVDSGKSSVWKITKRRISEEEKLISGEANSG